MPPHPLPLFPSRPAAAAAVNAPRALVQAPEPRPEPQAAPAAWRAVPADSAAAAAAPPAQQPAKSLLQALVAQHHKPQAVDSAKREELARLFRHAAAATTAGAAAARPVSEAAPVARPLVPPAPRVAVTAADVAAATARRLHDAQMIALLQEATATQKKEAAFMALAHAKLPPVCFSKHHACLVVVGIIPPVWLFAVST